MDRCWLQGAAGDALHAVLCAAGYNVRGCYAPSCAWGSRALPRLCLRCLKCSSRRSRTRWQRERLASREWRGWADEFCRGDHAGRARRRTSPGAAHGQAHLERASAQALIHLHVNDRRFDGTAPINRCLQGPCDTSLLARAQDPDSFDFHPLVAPVHRSRALLAWIS